MNEQINNSPLINKPLEDGAVPDGFKPVDIDFVQFEKPGDTITGRLIAKNQIRVKGQPIGKYTVQVLHKGIIKDVSFLGSVHLDELLSRIAIGHTIMVTFTNEELLDSGFKMKRFKVFTKENR